MSSLIALAAGIGIWYVFSQATSTRSFVIIPVAAGVVAAMLLLMLKESTQTGHDRGSMAAQTDVYTRLPSHAVAHHFLQREFAAAERGRTVSVVLFSLDNLPKLAAAKGAGEANKVLLAAGTILKKRTRGMNMTARLDGGYTFMSVLGTVDEAGAARFAEKVTRDLSTISLHGRPLEIRVGIAGYHPEMQSADDLVAHAYDALAEFEADGGGLLTA